MKQTLAKRAAPEWPQAKDIYIQCGPYQMQAVLAAHGRAHEVEELYVSRLHRSYDATLPWDVSQILGRYGIRTRLRFYLRSSFIKKVAAALTQGEPVLAVVRSIQGTGCLHWISLWGYDEATDEFLAYDSQCATTTDGHGNVRYSPAQLLKSLPWRGTFAVQIVHE